MKNRLSLLVCLLIFSLSLSAQQSFSFGVTGGVNLAMLKTANVPSTSPPIFEQDRSSLAGLQFGVMATYYFNSKFALVSNLLFAQKGYQLETNDQQFEPNLKIREQYLNLPVFLRFHPVGKFFVEGGMELGYLLSAKSHLDDLTINLKEIGLHKDFDFGLGVGLGVNINSKISLNFRYIHGLANVLEPIIFTDVNGEPIPGSEDIKYRNQIFQLSAGFNLWQN